jgi:uncharacterized membrane protein YpjA
MASGFSKAVFWLLVLGNIMGAIFGFTYWYGSQLLANPVLYWVFIAGSPLYALLFVVCAFMIYFRKKNSFLFFITAVGLVKFGIWTVVFWSVYNGTPIVSWLFYWLVISHSIMVLEAMVLFSRIEFRKWHLIFAWVWFGLTDYMNYSLKFITDKVAINSREMYVAIALTVLVPLIVYWLVKFFRYRNWKILI